MLIGLFLLVLLLTFVIVFAVTKPNKAERSLNERLETITREQAGQVEAADTPDILKRETLSDVPWVDVLLTHLPLAYRFKGLIAESDSNWTVGRLLSGSLVGFIATSFLSNFWINNIIVNLVLGVVVAALPFVYLKIKRAARLNKFNVGLPDAIDLMSRALKAGHSISSAIEIIAQEGSEPVSTEFRRLFDEQNFGLPMREAMMNMVRRVPVADLHFLVTAILVQKETGGNLVEVLDKTAAVLRDRIRLKGQLRIYTAQGKLTGWILCILPFVVFGVISILNPNYSTILTSDPAGQKMIIAGLVLMGLGVYVIRRIVDIKV